MNRSEKRIRTVTAQHVLKHIQSCLSFLYWAAISSIQYGLLALDYLALRLLIPYSLHAAHAPRQDLPPIQTWFGPATPDLSILIPYLQLGLGLAGLLVAAILAYAFCEGLRYAYICTQRAFQSFRPKTN